MLILKAFHIIAMVAWFAALFYLPRLFVYHADATDSLSLTRFNLMERRLYYAIMWPAGIITTLLGMGLFSLNATYYWHASWMHAKLMCVGLLWAFHLICGHFMRRFNRHENSRTSRFYRVFNEIPTLLLMSIVLLAVIKP